MTNDLAFLRAMASTIRRIAEKRGRANRSLGYDLQALAVFTDAAALGVEEDDAHNEFRSEEPTAPAQFRSDETTTPGHH